jgi:hypothetical protein
MKSDSLSKIIADSERVAAEEEKKRKEEEARRKKEAEELAQKAELRRVYEATQKKAAEEKTRQEAEKKGKKRKTAAELFEYMKANLSPVQKEAGAGVSPIPARASPSESPPSDGGRKSWLKRAYEFAASEFVIVAACMVIGGGIGGYLGGRNAGLKIQEVTAENKVLRDANADLGRKLASVDSQSSEIAKLAGEYRSTSTEFVSTVSQYLQIGSLVTSVYSNKQEDKEKAKPFEDKMSELARKAKSLAEKMDSSSGLLLSKLEAMKQKQEISPGFSADKELKEIIDSYKMVHSSTRALAALANLDRNAVARTDVNYKSLVDERDRIQAENNALSEKVKQCEKRIGEFMIAAGDSASERGSLYDNNNKLNARNKELEARVSELEGVLKKTFGSVDSAIENLKGAGTKPSGQMQPLTDKNADVLGSGSRLIHVINGQFYGGTDADKELFEKIRKYEPNISLNGDTIELIDIGAIHPSSKKIDEIPPELKSYCVRNVCLFGNRIMKLSNLENARFDSLSLGRNLIIDVSGVKDVGCVKSLDLAYNKIRTLGKSENWKGVTERLLIYGNPIDYSDPENVKTIESLRARGVEVVDKEPAQGGVR